jgi:hypothetical protein
VLYKDADSDKRSFGLLHCWNLCSMPRSGRTSIATATTKNRRNLLQQVQGQLLLEHMKVTVLMKRTVQVILHQGKVCRPEGQKEEKERQGKNRIAHGDQFETMGLVCYV